MPEIALLNPFRRPAAASISTRMLVLDGETLAGPPAPGGNALEYRLVRASRRTLAIHVGADGVEVRAPRWASIGDIEGFMRLKARWIRRRLANAQRVEPFRWEEGACLPILGTAMRLTAAPGLRGIARNDTALLIGDAPRRATRNAPAAGDAAHEQALQQARDWRKRVLAWLRGQALAHYAGRAAEIAAALAVPLPALKLSNAAKQWGSCIRRSARNGNDGSVRVLLHWKLYLMPPHLVDYVVAHELAHIRELNHSARFWAEVARVYPDPVAARRELNRLGRALPQL